MSRFDALLRQLEIGIEAFAICEMRGHCRLELEREKSASLHYVLRGAGTIRLAGAGPRPFAERSIIIVPPGAVHTLSPDDSDGRAIPAAEAECVSVADGLVKIGVGDGGPCLIMACGRVQAGFGPAAGLFAHMREPIVEHFAADDRVAQVFTAMLTEFAAPQPGSRALIEALMKQCLILVFRRQLAGAAAALPWLAALTDPRLGRALEAILDRPCRPLSVDELAAAAGLGRSAFTERFAAAFGRSPIDFHRDVRMHRAARLLATTALPVKTVAVRVGYDSRSHFSRTFKTRYGIGPAEYRARGAGAVDDMPRPAS